MNDWQRIDVVRDRRPAIGERRGGVHVVQVGKIGGIVGSVVVVAAAAATPNRAHDGNHNRDDDERGADNGGIEPHFAAIIKKVLVNEFLTRCACRVVVDCACACCCC